MKTFSHYLQLYTLHFVEQNTSQQRLIHIRLSTVQYLLSHLPNDIETAWQQEHTINLEVVQRTTAHRVQQLLDDPIAQQRLLTTHWQPYQALRQHQALPEVPRIRPAAQTTGMERRIDQAERILQLMKTTLEVANAGLVLWQTWQATRNERQQLIDAIRTTLQGQTEALQVGTAQDFVTGYLAAHTDDPIYPLLFDQSEDEN